jgi:hypothetical protein
LISSKALAINTPTSARTMNVVKEEGSPEL